MKNNGENPSGKAMGMQFVHYHPEIESESCRKRYFTAVTRPSFESCEGKAAREDMAQFELVIEDRELLSDADAAAIEELVNYTAAMLYGCNVDTDGLQLGVRNDPEGDLIWKRDVKHPNRYHISFCVDYPDDWSQLIYQLGYTFTHCIIDYHGGSGKVPWVEETVCEMMSVWLLNRFMQNWSRLELSGRNPEYADCLAAYLHDFLTEQEWTDRPAACASLGDILDMNINSVNRSDERVGAVIHLFYLTTPDDIEGLMKFPVSTFADRPGLLDTKRWTGSCPDNLAVRYLSSLQDNAAQEDAVY